MAHPWQRLDAFVKAHVARIGGPTPCQSDAPYSACSVHARASEHYVHRARDFGWTDCDCFAVVALLEPFALGPDHQVDELFYSPTNTFIADGRRITDQKTIDALRGPHQNHCHAGVKADCVFPTVLPPVIEPAGEDAMPTVVAQDIVMQQKMDPATGVLYATGRGYLLDAQGAVHPVGGAPAPPATGQPGAPADWPIADGTGPARRLIISDWAKPAGWVMDSLGALHPFGGAPATPGPFWPHGFIPPAVKV